MSRQTVELVRVIVRFAIDSGDGMQLTVDRNTSAGAIYRNNLALVPDFLTKIRAMNLAILKANLTGTDTWIVK
jgi:2-oxoglutarate/2-oxoacid ferredoxin oxidoreductase subunit alpha